MKKCSRCGVTKALTAFYSDPNPRSKTGKQSRCIDCAKESAREKYRSDPSYAKKKWVAWKKRNPDKLREQYKRKIAKNPAKYRALATERQRRHRERTPDVYDAKKNKERMERWRKLHPEAEREIKARRRTAMKRIPAWGDKEKIRVVYQKAREWKMEVEHVVPLRHELVSGLHVWANLQLMKRSENAKKGNRMWPDMP